MLKIRMLIWNEKPENPETDVHLKTAQFYETAPIRDMDMRLEKI